MCVMEMLGMKKFRRMALRLITQLIMLDGTLSSLTHPLTHFLSDPQAAISTCADYWIS